MRTLKFLTAACLLIFYSAAHAQLKTSKIVCTYASGSGNQQTVTFESPEGADLSAYPPVSKTIPLSINGSAEPTLFQVRGQATHVGVSVVYSLRNPFFISDITIVYSINQLSGETSLNGTWIVDHPPVLELDCRFGDMMGEKAEVF